MSAGRGESGPASPADRYASHGKPVVLHVINTMRWGGVRRHVSDLMQGLPAHGFGSRIAAWLPPGDMLHGDDRATHLPLYSDDAGEKKSISGIFIALRRLRVLFRQHPITVVHTHSRYAMALVCLALSGRSSVRYRDGRRLRHLYTTHNTFSNLSWLPCYPAHIIAPSEEVRRHFEAHVRFSRRRQVHIIPHGIPIPSGVRQAADGTPRFCFIGRLCEEKGVEVLMAAIQLLHAQGGEIPDIDIIGDGPMMPRLQEWHVSLASDAIRLHGFLSDPAKLLPGCTALLFPSTHLDTVGYVILDAMAHGVPVIASDLAVLRPLVRNGETGWVFPVGDAAALADRLRRASAGPAEMQAMGARARMHVQAHHDIEDMCAATATVYSRLAGNGSIGNEES
ncbi:MAG: glycosyltransferase family 4 protein [Bacteroidetes bacterium]|nr:glycosyltransferase family 4 protein [Bacteroidota bacterium]